MRVREPQRQNNRRFNHLHSRVANNTFPKRIVVRIRIIISIIAVFLSSSWSLIGCCRYAGGGRLRLFNRNNGFITSGKNYSSRSGVFGIATAASAAFAPSHIRALTRVKRLTGQNSWLPPRRTVSTFNPRFRHSITSVTKMADTTTTDSNNGPDDNKLSFVDIGANLLEERFTKGIYRGTFRHEPDMDLILERAQKVGVKRLILTAGTIKESRNAVQMAREWNRLYRETYDIHFACTVGVHPTRCKQVFEPDDDEDNDDNDKDNKAQKPVPDDLLQELLSIAQDGISDDTVVAIGEIGLDYDRFEFCPKDVQQKYLIRQLQVVANECQLPLFLHNRSVGTDLYDILKQYPDCWTARGGVVHSFDDTLELGMKFINDLGLYIGLNGCSLKTQDNLHVVQQLPLDKVLLETDCPYCEVRNTHAGFQHVHTKFNAKAEKKFERGLCVKNRQEPCHIIQIAEIVAGCKQVSLQQVAQTCYDNTLQLYGWK